MPSSLESPLPEFQFELVRVPAAEAVATWRVLRREGRGAFTPVVMDAPGNYALDPAALAQMRLELPGTLADAGAMSVTDFFARRNAANAALFQELETGGWPESPCKLEPYLPRSAEVLFIAKVPTPNSYEALGHIGFGGWNDCPADEEHIAVLRYWQERYGADLFAVGGDMIECVVERPPSTRDAALSLAREQLLYAPGSLDEFSGRIGSVPELAAALLNSRHWLFWWD